MTQKFLILLVCFIPFKVFPQNISIQKTDISTTFSPEISLTSDGGWYLYVREFFGKTRITKFNPCGEPEWSKQLLIDYSNIIQKKSFAVDDSDFLYLLSETGEPNGRTLRISAISPMGISVWSKTIFEPSYDRFHGTCTIEVNHNGDLVILTHADRAGSGRVVFLKMDTSGNLLLCKEISPPFGYFFGSLTLTNDGGYLLRMTNRLVKLNEDANIEWSIFIDYVFNYPEYLNTVEVEDGYIFCLKEDVGGDVVFYKVDKNGNFTNTTAKVLSSLTRTPSLTLAPNGNVVFFVKKTVGVVQKGTTLIEMDKDFNIIHQNTIGAHLTNTNFSHITFKNNGLPIIAGVSGLSGNNPVAIWGGLDREWKSGCDTNASLIFRDKQFSGGRDSITSYIKNYQLKSHSLKDSVVNFSQNEVCKTFYTPILKLGKDTTLCLLDTLILENKSNDKFDQYLWSNGQTTPTLLITEPGTYWLQANYYCDSLVYSDTIVVEEYEFPEPQQFVFDSVICRNEVIKLNAFVPFATYEWQDGSTNPGFEVVTPGNYNVLITSNNCKKNFTSEIGGCEEIKIPNVFTPNGDGVNDYFEILYFGNQPFNVEIYDRWGNFVFGNSEIGFSWDGRSPSGEIHPSGVYYYVVTIGDRNFQGHLSLFR